MPFIVLQSLGHIYLWTGQLERARQIANMLIQGVTRSGITIMKNWGDYFLAMACFQSSELDYAAHSFSEIITIAISPTSLPITMPWRVWP